MNLGRSSAGSDRCLLDKIPPTAEESVGGGVMEMAWDSVGNNFPPPRSRLLVTHAKSMARSLPHTFAMGAATSALSNVLVDVISAYRSADKVHVHVHTRTVREDEDDGTLKGSKIPRDLKRGRGGAQLLDSAKRIQHTLSSLCHGAHRCIDGAICAAGAC